MRKSFIGTIVAGGLLLVSPALGAITFDPGTEFGIGDFGRDIATGDVDLDGNLDIVANNGSGRTERFSVLFGDGNGSFAGQTNYPIGGNTQDVKLGLLNDDAYPDIIVLSQDNATFSIFLNQGDGTFGSATSYGLGSIPNKLLIDDFTGDGELDIVASRSTHFQLRSGLGDGTFGALVTSPISARSYFVGMASGDYNEDGHLDIIASDFNKTTISYFAGNGDGTFQSAVPIEANGASIAVQSGDFNHDGNLDVAVGQPLSSKRVSIFMGNGDGTFSAPQPYDVGSSAWELAVGDFDLDGRLDVAGTSFIGKAFVFPGIGDGTLGTRIDLSGSNVQNNGLVSGDFDNDGALDIANMRVGDNEFVVYLNLLDPVPPVSDSDAIADIIENRGPNLGDGNGDLIQDSTQSNVTSFPGQDGNYVTIVGPPGSVVSDASHFDKDLIPGPLPVGYLLREGMINFTLDGLTPGALVSIDLIFENGGPWDAYYKKNSQGTEFISLIETVDFDIVSTHTVRLHIQDGGLLDLDGIANGSIVDPGGPAISDTLLSVVLIEFTASELIENEQGVSVKWSTASEIGTAGFDLFRAEGDDSSGYTLGDRITPSLIIGEGNEVVGARYEVIDPDPLTDGERRGYFLRELENSGKTVLYGPAFVTGTGRGISTVEDWYMF